MKETLSLSWDAHQKNICSGLSLLQQRGEFVDMTLAADGYHVKVHQMVISLASPYIKALISSAQCPHPVIFLNNISYATLRSILEYIYTGEVHIPKEGLRDLIAAGKALHVKGLKEMNDTMEFNSGNDRESSSLNTTLGDKVQVSEGNKNHYVTYNETEKPKEQMCEVFVESAGEDCDDREMMLESADISTTNVIQDDKNLDTSTCHSLKRKKNKECCSSAHVQYTISNQGNLQLIVNRYIYNLKYVQKNKNRYWRCVEYAGKKCPANIYTNDDHVLKRRSAHNHPFHDGKIFKKLRLNIIFEAFNEAKDRAEQKKAMDTVELVKHSTSSDDSE